MMSPILYHLDQAIEHLRRMGGQPVMLVELELARVILMHMGKPSTPRLFEEYRE